MEKKRLYAGREVPIKTARLKRGVVDGRRNCFMGEGRL